MFNIFKKKQKTVLPTLKNPIPMPKCKPSKQDNIKELYEWLKGEKYLIDENSTTMTEEFENAHQWELSRNYIIEKTIKKIKELNLIKEEN